MGNIETTTKFSRLKSISSIEDNYSFSNLFVFECLVTNTKENYYPVLSRKCSLEFGLKKSEFLKGFFSLFVFGFPFTIKIMRFL